MCFETFLKKRIVVILNSESQEAIMWFWEEGKFVDYHSYSYAIELTIHTNYTYH